jgi:hypothetical protein
MTTLTLDLALDAPPAHSADGDERDAQRGHGGGEPHREAPRAAEGRGRRTLDELVVGVWEDLLAHRAAACPLCAAPMSPRYGSASAPVGGRCSGCGTTLG